MKKELSFGAIEYRYPDLIEAMDYMHVLNLDVSKMSDSNYIESNIFLYLGKILKGMAPYLTKIELEMEGVKVDTFPSLIKYAVSYPELKEACLGIAQEIFQSLAGSEKKG